MKLYYDFHIHTALSPCGDESMTPNNIVQLAQMLGFECIAITDHNSCKNVEAVMSVAKDTPLLVIAGMEVETSEEIHVICLFKTLADAQVFDDLVSQKINKIQNKEKVFGRQSILDASDEEVGVVEQLLITSTSFTLYQVFEEVRKLDGIAIPAHIDRASYSVLSNLGFIPEDLPVSVVELSKDADQIKVFEQMKGFSSKEYPFIRSSDAHYLEQMMEAKDYLEFETMPNAGDVIEALRNKIV